MRVMFQAYSFFDECQTLMHAKAVLFINNDETQTGKFNIILKQGIWCLMRICWKIFI